MRLIFVPLLLLGWPLAEIAGFVLVGRAVGLWGTLGLVVGTGLLGAILMRHQGMHLLRQISQESREGRVPARPMIDGGMVVLAGLFLLLPGFITDILGLLLFVPGIRSLIWSVIGQRVIVVGSGRNSFAHRGRGNGTPRDAALGSVLDLNEDEFRRSPDPSSPWAAPERKDR